MNYGGTDYYFDKNILGEVMKIYNTSGAEVGSYRYDPLGEVKTISGGIAEKNAFRYRGYYYDTETGFYYLQTRYYDPSIRRFISADNYELIPALAQTLGQLNMYAYCNNNPVMYTDETGEFFGLFLILGVFAVAGGVIGGSISYNKGSRGLDLIADIFLWSGIGLAIGGTFIIFSAIGAYFLGYSTVFGGVKLIQAFAIGELAFDFTAFFVMPLYGIKMQAIEFGLPNNQNPIEPPNFSRDITSYYIIGDRT